MSADPPGTRCAECGRRYAPSTDEPHRCDCGGPLELDLPWGVPDDLSVPLGGLWSTSSALPPGPVVELGAGGTPLVAVEPFHARFKLETCNPTGSFKDRGAAVTISRALALGADRVREDSSGNAGRAIAASAARAGLDATIYVPESVDASTLAAIEATGADLVAIAGDRAAVRDACLADEAGWYASHAWRPEFYRGTATCAWELVGDLGGTPPDALVLPVGHGTLLLGCYRGFRALVDGGHLEGVPRLYAAQLAGAGSLGEPPRRTVDPAIAPGVSIDEPARERQVREAITASGGRVVEVDPAAVIDTRDRLARNGFDVGSTAALGVAGRAALLDAEPPERDVIVPLTGRSRDR